MLPMSLWESRESTGEVSLSRLFNDPDYDIGGCRSKMSIEDLIFAACRGGWPATEFHQNHVLFQHDNGYVNDMMGMIISA